MKDKIFEIVRRFCRCKSFTDSHCAHSENLLSDCTAANCPIVAEIMEVRE